MPCQTPTGGAACFPLGTESELSDHLARNAHPRKTVPTGRGTRQAWVSGYCCRQASAHPPSTRIVAPIMREAAGEVRKTTAPATSIGSPMRRKGMRARVPQESLVGERGPRAVGPDEGRRHRIDGYLMRRPFIGEAP
jgi:hypothetical protein